MFTRTTRRSFDEFMELLSNFDKDYYRSSSRTIYRRGRKKMDKIETICKENKDFQEVFNLWDRNNKTELENIRRQLQ